MKIGKDAFVTIKYLIRLGENETYPMNGEPEEISFCMGWGAMPSGLEEAMMEMEVSQHKAVHLTPEEAYGDLDPELIMEVPRSDFAPEVELRPGLVFETENEEGHAVYFVVREIKPDAVVIDFNHPLAGRELDVDFTVQEVREATSEDLERERVGCECEECGEETPHRH
jgi:FKBP-type peptidyl-prolyl cis-trans isomerase SlyD